MKKSLKKISAIIAAATILLTMSVTALATDTTAASTTKDSGKTAIWSILTEDQKAQLLSDAKTKLAQDLADGKITQAQYDKRIAAIDSGEMPLDGRGHGTMTDAQKTAMDATKAKWDALTDAQKAEIYDLYDQKVAIDSKIVDKYLALGVIDATTAATMKENLASQKTDMRTSGKMPSAGGKGARGSKSTTATSSTTTASN